MMTREKMTQLLQDYFRQGKLSAVFNLIVENVRVRRSSLASDPAIKFMMRELSKVRSDCCYVPIRLNVTHDRVTDTYSIAANCPRCSENKSLDAIYPRYWLLDLREKMNKTVEEVAAATGLHPRTIRKAEQHCGVMDVTPIDKLSRFYGVSLLSIRYEPYLNKFCAS